ncbi:autophagy protein 17 [Ascosphaera aggregata]|nr:autophagy protein 17 [Ascosphaera aggregata]
MELSPSANPKTYGPQEAYQKKKQRLSVTDSKSRQNRRRIIQLPDQLAKEMQIDKVSQGKGEEDEQSRLVFSLRLINQSKMQSQQYQKQQEQQQQQLQLRDGEHQSEPVSVDTLIRHLVHAKRHLSSIAQLYRAQNIVQLARQSLQDSVIISSRTIFLRRGLNDQLSLLYAIRQRMEDVLAKGKHELGETIAELDGANDLVKEALEELGSTQVEKGFLVGREDEGDMQAEQGLTLRDFIEESGVQGLHADLKDAIDNVSAVQLAFVSSNEVFDSEIKGIRKQLARHRQVVIKACDSVSSSAISSFSSASSRHSRNNFTDDNGPSLAVLPELLRTLESRAEYLADLLQSLVRHYDLCVTALRHTEGGWAAARSIVGDLSADTKFDTRKPGSAAQHDDGSRDHNVQHADQGRPLDDLEPLSPEEYQQMLQVITTDAPLAMDAACEIAEHLAEMEGTLTHVLQGRDAFVNVYTSTLGVCRAIEKLVTSPVAGVAFYIQQARNYEEVWAKQKARLNDGITSLIDLRELYMSFLSAYDKCILEAARRDNVWKSVERVLRNTRAELDRIYAADQAERLRVREEVAMYLPIGVWNGLGQGMGRISFVRTAGGDLVDEEEISSEQMAEQATSRAEGVPAVPVDITSISSLRLLAPESVEDRSMPTISKEAIAAATRRMNLRSQQRKRTL